MMSGEYKGDIVFIDSGIPFSVIAGKGILTPLDDYINFEEGFFNNHLQNRSIWNGKHYGLTYLGELGAQFQNLLLTYNREVIESNGFPDIFELQQNGQLTWDKYTEIARKVTSNTDGNGINDVWGTVISYLEPFFRSFVHSNGTSLVKQDDNGRFISNNTDPAVTEAAEFLYKQLHVYKSMLSGNDITNMVVETLMTQNRAAFGFSMLHDSQNFPQLRKAFYPKGPRALDYTSVRDAGEVYAIPSYIENKKETAVVLAKIIKFLNKENDYLNSIKKLTVQMRSLQLSRQWKE